MNKKNNKIIISIISIIVALVICFFGYTLYQKKQVETVSSEKLTALHELTKKFNDENDRNKRLELLKDTLDEQSKYNLSSNKDLKVQDEFKNSINTMRTYFHNDYDNTLKKYTISDISSSSDNNKINDSKSKLDELTKTIEKEKDYTFETEKEAQEKQTEIEKLVKKYEEQIKEIEKKTEEKKKATPSDNTSALSSETHYENEYFSVDIPDKWIGLWSMSEYSEEGGSVLRYAFSYSTKAAIPTGGIQQVLVFKNGQPSNKYSGLTKIGKNVYIDTGATAPFFSSDISPGRATIKVK